MSKVALISGARGQDASYLSDFLLDKGYEVVAFERRISSPDYCNIEHILNHPRYHLVQGDITDHASIVELLKTYEPDEFYNLAAQSFVGASWKQSLATCNVNFMGVANCLEAIRLEAPQTRFFQASTSEVYGDVLGDIQDEDTPARPCSPYGASKHGAESLLKSWRDSYGLYACFARSFNHESVRRDKKFVTRKITSNIGAMWHKAVGPICDFDSFLKNNKDSIQERFDKALESGKISPIPLGNMEARRDWSHAKDVVRGMWLMLQQDSPKDYVLSSGATHSISDFLGFAFGVIGVRDWKKFAVVNPEFYRPADVNLLCGDSSRIRKELGWSPQYTLSDLVEEMVIHDIRSECI